MVDVYATGTECQKRGVHTNRGAYLHRCNGYGSLGIEPFTVKVLPRSRYSRLMARKGRISNEPHYEHLIHNIDLFKDPFFVKWEDGEVSLAWPRFTYKRALAYLGLEACSEIEADKKCEWWGKALYADWQRPDGEKILDHGRAVDTYAAWLVLGSGW